MDRRSHDGDRRLLAGAHGRGVGVLVPIIRHARGGQSHGFAMLMGKNEETKPTVLPTSVLWAPLS